MTIRTAAMTLASIAIGVVCGGCATPPTEPGPDTIRFSLAVRDNHLRAPDTECAGSGPYLYVHAGAAYAVEDTAGTLLAQGELPAGRAWRSDAARDHTVARVPTFCVVEFAVPDLPNRPSYQLRLQEGSPLPFRAPNDLTDGEPVALVIP